MLLELLAHLGEALPATSTPTPTPSSEPFNEDTVTPGLFGFLLTMVVAGAAVLLSIDMIRRVRRTTYREMVTEELDREEDEAKRKSVEEQTAID